MERTKTVNAMTSADAAKESWYLSMKPASPKQTLSVKINDGRSYKYLGAGIVNFGDPVVIDYGGATSYQMGNVDGIENGITVKRSHTLKALFTFTTNPGKTEIKKNAAAVSGLDFVEEVKSYYYAGKNDSPEDKFRIVDYLVNSVLSAISVVAFPKLSSAEVVNDAKAFLAEGRPVPGIVFGKEYYDKYFIVNYGDYFTDKYEGEVALTGHYPEWQEDLKNTDLIKKGVFEEFGIKPTWNKDETVCYLRFRSGGKKREKFATENEAFLAFTNELVLRSALSILIRGGFVNLLEAALSVEMPIKGFYDKLKVFAKEVGSKKCLELLEKTDYVGKTFEKIQPKQQPKSKSTSKTSAKSKPVISAEIEFCIKGDVLEKYTGNDETVIVPDGVKFIEKEAFSGNVFIKKVVIPDSVTQIKEKAFSWCRALEEVQFGKNITSLGKNCFAVTSLRQVDLSNTKLKTLLSDCFERCSNIKSFVLPKTLKTIKSRALYDATIEKLIIPASVDTIEGSVYGPSYGSVHKVKEVYFEGTKRFVEEWFFPYGATLYCKKGSELWDFLEGNMPYINKSRRKLHEEFYHGEPYSDTTLKEL